MLKKGVKVVNTKYDDIQKDYLSRAKFLKMKDPFVYCPDCGKQIWHDHNNIQRHYTLEHINDRVIKREKGYKFVPGPGRNKRII